MTRVVLRCFRSYASAEISLGPRLTVVTGANAAGKTNLLEAVFFGCTGRSCRTANEREILTWGSPVARVELSTLADDGSEHALTVGFEPPAPKHFTIDGAPVERLLDAPVRPLVSVFLPARLELVTGPPAGRRAHLDQVVSALRPARAGVRRAFGQALAQRNALLARIRAGMASRASLAAWDAELARHGFALIADRGETVSTLAPRFGQLAAELGLAGEASLSYRPRSHATNESELAAELTARTDSDLERGFTGHGPHRDELVLLRDGRDLRVFGSQGEQRIALLSLLLAEREVIADSRGRPPLLLLDDVMSELDGERRRLLVQRLGDGGQVIITATEPQHVPGSDVAGVTELAVAGGRVESAATARALRAA